MGKRYVDSIVRLTNSTVVDGVKESDTCLPSGVFTNTCISSEQYRNAIFQAITPPTEKIFSKKSEISENLNGSYSYLAFRRIPTYCPPTLQVLKLRQGAVKVRLFWTSHDLIHASSRLSDHLETLVSIYCQFFGTLSLTHKLVATRNNRELVLNGDCFLYSSIPTGILWFRQPIPI